MDQLDWPQIRDALTAAIRDALPLQIRRAAGDRIAGVGLHIDGYYGSAGLYLLPESAARALAPEGADNLGDWPISTDWNQSEDHAQAFMVHWRPWDQWIYNHVGDFDDEATMARGRELLRAGCEAVQLLENAGFFNTFQRTEGFKIIVADHDEPQMMSLERYGLFVETGAIRCYGD